MVVEVVVGVPEAWVVKYLGLEHRDCKVLLSYHLQYLDHVLNFEIRCENDYDSALCSHIYRLVVEQYTGTVL